MTFVAGAFRRGHPRLPVPPDTGDRFVALAQLSDAPLAEPDAVGEVPALDAPPPVGAFERVDGRGLFVRTTEHAPATATDTWYLHGLAGSSTNFLSLAGVLARTSRGHLVDLPGHGRSDPPPRGRYRLHNDADLVAALIRRRAAGPVHLVGNSLGGMVATVLAARHPGLVADLTLISPAVPDLRLGHDRGADARLGVLMLPGTGNLAVRRLSAISPRQRAQGMAELCFGDPSKITSAQLDAAAEDLGWRSVVPWVHTATVSSLRALIRSYLPAGARGFRALAGRIQVPVLVVWGTKDRLVDPRLAERTAAAFADARLLVLAGVGHTAQMEDPAATARAVLALWRAAPADYL